MNKMLLSFLFFVLAINPCYSQADNLTFGSIVGKGVGLDYNNALEYAKRDALERSVGVYISSETIIKNDQLLNDKIYSLSSGFVKKYEVLSTTILSPTTTEVIISADISKDALFSEIKNAGITIELNGGGLFEQFNQIQKYDQDEYSIFRSLFNNPPNYSPYNFSVEYDKPVFNEAEHNCKVKFHIKGNVNENAKAITQKTKSILDNISFDNAIGEIEIDESGTSYTILPGDTPEYKQLRSNYQSRTCIKSETSHYLRDNRAGMFMMQLNNLKRKPYSPYIIEFENKIYSVHNIETFIFLRTFYFFYFLPNLKVEFVSNSGQIIKEKTINEEIIGTTTNIKGKNWVFFDKEFCNKTIEKLENCFLFNLDIKKYKRENYTSEFLDHELFEFGNMSSSPRTPFLDLNCYNNLQVTYDFELTFTDSEIKNISKIQVLGLPVLLKLENIKNKPDSNKPNSNKLKKSK
jgi:hypothetical protein